MQTCIVISQQNRLFSLGNFQVDQVSPREKTKTVPKNDFMNNFCN